MSKFFKENTIFITSTILLAGLFVGVSILRKTPNANQVSLDQIPSINITDTTGSQPTTPDITVSQPINTPTVPKTISKPAPSPVVNTPIRQRFQNEDDD